MNLKSMICPEDYYTQNVYLIAYIFSHAFVILLATCSFYLFVFFKL